MRIVISVIIFISFGYYGFSQDIAVEDDSSLTVLRNSLVELHWSIKEIESISDFFSGNAYVNNEATEDVFKEKAKNASIVHLATHTLLDDNNPLYSKMVFAKDVKSAEDGFLNLFELYNMDLESELVVLSACNTGYGKIVNGEGIMSMARGFIYAGCPSIVMSLWPVDDHSTSVLMKYFYKGISDGLEKDEALRQAKLKYLQNSDDSKSDPFFWAGFVEVGNTEPIYLKPKSKNYLWIFVSVILLIGITFIFKRYPFFNNLKGFAFQFLLTSYYKVEK